MSEPLVPPSFPLEECCVALAAELRAALVQHGRSDLAALVARLGLPAQAIADSAEDFGFMVRLEPPLAPQPARDRRDWEPLTLRLARGELQLWLDDFGRPSEIRVIGRADLHQALKSLHGHIGPR